MAEKYPNTNTGYPEDDRGEANVVVRRGFAMRGEFAPVPVTASVAATRTIAAGDPMIQYLTPTAARTGVMPATTQVCAYLIVNLASTAGRTLTVTDAAAATIVVIDVGQSAWVISNGTTWAAVRGVKGSAPMTDNSTGTAGSTIAAGTGIYNFVLPVNLASVANGDVLTNIVFGHRFKVLKETFAVTVPVTTGSKLATLNSEIGTTNVTGSALALTSANCTPLGALVVGGTITAANVGTATDTFSVEAASVTAFVEGAGVYVAVIQNMDTADAVASLIARA